MPPEHGRHYGPCAVCKRAITPKQTWKFQPATGKRIHYYCDPRGNPSVRFTLWVHIVSGGHDYWKPWAHGAMARLQQEAKSRGWSPEHIKILPFEEVVEGQRNPAGPNLESALRAYAELVLKLSPMLGVQYRGNLAGYMDEIRVDFRRAVADGEIVLRSDGTVDYGRHDPVAWYGKRVNPAGPTFHQAVVMARAAGAKIGDTSGFGPWLARVGLDTRGPQVRRELEAAFWTGVDKGVEKATRARPSAGKPQVWQVEDGWKTTLDPESVFDTREDAERFVAAQRNPRRQNPSQPWWKRRTA